MSYAAKWLFDFDADRALTVPGLVPVEGYVKEGRPPEEVVSMERALHYGADAVFFEAEGADGRATAQAFIYCSSDSQLKADFALLHRQLWSWGGVPLVFRVSGGLVQLFRCAHKPDFVKRGELVESPYKTVRIASEVLSDPWWDAEKLRNGAVWDDPRVCRALLSSEKAAQKTLIKEVAALHQELVKKSILPKALRRRLLILSILIAYLEARKVFEPGFFGKFLPNATAFFEVLADGQALLSLLADLERRFNGHVFVLSEEERSAISASNQLGRFARLIEGRQTANGQMTLWQRYSFADLPVELISHIYQLFVKDSSVAVYTPHFLVKLMLGEVLTWERLDRLENEDEAILDAACGSGIFLVEAYKRVILHWRSRNKWARPKLADLKRLLTKRIRGCDIEEGAIELAAFSLCLALCDSLEPEEIRSSVKLFPVLKEKTLVTSCFFSATESNRFDKKIGVIVGNPPFASKLSTEAARRAYESASNSIYAIPDKQIAYLFLLKSLDLLQPGGALSLLQPSSFLYNEMTALFRRALMHNWNVKEILDFVSINGLFKRARANPKVVVVVADTSQDLTGTLVHATFRGSGRVEAELGFDIDYYDLHRVPRQVACKNDKVWRSNLLGGGRVLPFIERLSSYPTIAQYADKRKWDFGEGWIPGKHSKPDQTAHVVGMPYLPSTAITTSGILDRKIGRVSKSGIERPRSIKRFTPPMLLVREQMDLPHAVWPKKKGYITYDQQVVGICAPPTDEPELYRIANWLGKEIKPLTAYIAATSHRLFSQRQTSISSSDIKSLPFPESNNLDLAKHEEILVEDIVEYYRDFILKGESSEVMQQDGLRAIGSFCDVFTSRINSVYKANPLIALPARRFAGLICQPFVFGEGDYPFGHPAEGELEERDWLSDARGSVLSVKRVARIYDGRFLLLIKPDRLRYWLKSIALRDADETFADLSAQGF